MMKTKLSFLSSVIVACHLGLFSVSAVAVPPALMTASFTKYKLSYEQCQKKAIEVMKKMNLQVEDHNNGTIAGFGEQSVAVVNCYSVDDKLFVQLAVSSQKETAAEAIMTNLLNLRNATDDPPNTTKEPIDHL